MEHGYIYGNGICESFFCLLVEVVVAHILFVSLYYPPEPAAAAVCVWENARRLAARGHQVTVLTTFPHYPTGVVAMEYRGALWREEWRDGVRVLRVWSYISANRGFWRRILAHLAFGCLVPLLALLLCRLGRPDCVIVQSPPLFTACAGRILAWVKGCRFVFMVSDLWPEAAIQLGVLRQPRLIALAEWLERSTYRRADLVWVVTEQLHQVLLQRGVPDQKLLLLTNGVDTETFAPQGQVAARETLGWEPCFTVLYVGTHGLSHGLQTVLATAQLLQDQQPNISIVLVGDGEEKPALQAEAQRRQLQNVTFLDPIPHEQVPQLLAAADVCLAHTRNLPLFTGVLPIKMLEAMSCARPLILALNGEAYQRAVEEAQAAIHVEPENAQALAEAILHLYEQPALTQELGANGRSYVETHFAYEHLVAQLDARLALLLA